MNWQQEGRFGGKCPDKQACRERRCGSAYEPQAALKAIPERSAQPLPGSYRSEMHNCDVIIRGGTVITESVTVRADVGIRGERIAAIGTDLAPGASEIDARGKLVRPGGVYSHAHIEQFSSNGLQTSDDWESATRSAAFGGTTTVIAFAAQHLGMNLAQVVEDYAAQARKAAIVDYAFHMIVADPTDAALREHLPALIKTGLSSIKVFMT